MNNEEIRNAFTAVMEQVENADDRAKLELAREYFSNEDFRQALSDYTFEQTYKPGKPGKQS